MLLTSCSPGKDADCVSFPEATQPETDIYSACMLSKKKGGEEHFKPGETTSWMSWIDWSLPSQLPEELVALAGVKERE